MITVSSRWEERQILEPGEDALNFRLHSYRTRKLSNREFYTLKFRSDFFKKKENDILNLGSGCLG